MDALASAHSLILLKVLGRCPANLGNTYRLLLCTAVSVEHPGKIVNVTEGPGSDVAGAGSCYYPLLRIALDELG